MHFEGMPLDSMSNLTARVAVYIASPTSHEANGTNIGFVLYGDSQPNPMNI